MKSIIFNTCTSAEPALPDVAFLEGGSSVLRVSDAPGALYVLPRRHVGARVTSLRPTAPLRSRRCPWGMAPKTFQPKPRQQPCGAPNAVMALRSLTSGYLAVAAIPAAGIEFSLEYSDDIDECWFPPDHWEPGCPLCATANATGYMTPASGSRAILSWGSKTYGAIVYDGNSRDQFGARPARR